MVTAFDDNTTSKMIYEKLLNLMNHQLQRIHTRQIKQNSLCINLLSDNKKGWPNKEIPDICMHNILQYLEIEDIISLSKTKSITH